MTSLPPISTALRHHVEGCLAISNASGAAHHANFAIEPESLDTWLAAHDARDRHPWLVAVHDDAVVAFAKASRWRGRCAYAHSAEVGIYIDPAWQGQGLGRALYDQLIAACREAHLHTLVAGIALPNPASVALHEACGFRPVGVFHEVGRKFDQWWDVGYWELVLEPSSGSSPAT